MKKIAWLSALMTFQLLAPVSAMADRPVVLELFTSQGCSSCPPADALLTEMAKDPSLLALSFHINYWDYLGWKDPYASPEGTARQRDYANTAGGGQVFTPQLIVDGTTSVVGSKERDVMKAIAAARSIHPVKADVSFAPLASAGKLSVKIKNSIRADVWLVYFRRHADTDVKAGENGGRKLASTNIVTGIRLLPASESDDAQYEVEMPSEGVAVLVQEPNLGHMLGAGSFFRSGE